MQFFGKEKKQNPLTTVLWCELLILFLYICLNLTEEDWILFKLAIQENAVIFLEILAVACFSFVAAFGAFLLELSQNGQQELQLSDFAAVSTGCSLLLISPYAVMTGMDGVSLICCMGVVAVSAGFTLLVTEGRSRLFSLLPCIGAAAAGMLGLGAVSRLISALTILIVTVYQAYKNFYIKSKVNKISLEKLSDKPEALLLVTSLAVSVLCSMLLCFVPSAIRYGIYLPLLLCLGYVTWVKWKYSLMLQKAAYEKRQRAGQMTQGGLLESLTESSEKKNEGDEAGADAEGEALEAESETADSSNQKADEKNTDTEEGQSTDAGETGLNDSEETESSASDSVGRMILNALPDDETWVYLVDKKEETAYRYQPESDSLLICGENTEPQLMDLIPKERAEEFKAFLLQEGTRQIEIPFWSRERSCYRDSVIMASPMEGDHNADLLIIYDITESIEVNKTAQRRLQEEIIRLKQQIELSEDEAYRMFLTTNEMLYDIIENKSGESKQHLRHVSSYADILLHVLMKEYPELAYSERDMEDICEGSVLHDVGKIMIPDAILHKHEQLTPEEFEIMKQHTVYGAQIINKMPYVKKYEKVMQYALELALHHHERVDGSGYPDGLKDAQILPYVEAVALADVYEALTTKRSYREGKSHEEACQLIESGKCGAFSDRMMKVFRKAEKELQKEHYTIETRV